MLNRNQIRKIESIEIPKDQIQKINEYRQQHNDVGTSQFTHFLRRETDVQGLCCLCMSLPTTLVTFRSGIVERYCEKHIDRIKDNLDDAIIASSKQTLIKNTKTIVN